MGYLVDANNEDISTNNNAGYTGGNYTWAIYFSPNAAATTRRLLIEDFVVSGRDLYLLFTTGGTNVISFGFKDTIDGYPTINWTSGFGAGEPHVVFGVWDGSDQFIYADTDSTAKNSGASANGPDTTGGDFTIGNEPTASPGGPDSPANSIIYWVAKWHRALTGTECATIGTFKNPLVIPDMINYWPFTNDGRDIISGQNATVTNATLTSHAGMALIPPDLHVIRFKPILVR